MEKTRVDLPRKNHPDPTVRQTTGITSAPSHQELEPIRTLPTMEFPAVTTQTTTVVPIIEDLQRTLFTTPHQTASVVNNTVPPGAPPRERRINLEENIIALGEDTQEATLKTFVSRNFDVLNNLLQEE